MGSVGEGIEPDWPAPSRVHSVLTLRAGGVSVASYESLNVGAHVGDVGDAVRENRRRVGERLGLPAEPVWLQQVHGVEVADLDVVQPRTSAGGAVAAVGTAPAAVAAPAELMAATLASEPPRADAAVTRTSGRVCVVQVADCMPVLFSARDGSAVGAAHAGWRGLAGGVLEATVRKLGDPPAKLIAWLGPTIGQVNFEVGDEVRAAFMASDPGAASAFEANARGRWQCDLYALARRRLSALGIRDIFGGGWCTYADAARFFSFRRDGQCGRMATLIWID